MSLSTHDYLLIALIVICLVKALSVSSSAECFSPTISRGSGSSTHGSTPGSILGTNHGFSQRSGEKNRNSSMNGMSNRGSVTDQRPISSSRAYLRSNRSINGMNSLNGQTKGMGTIRTNTSRTVFNYQKNMNDMNTKRLTKQTDQTNQREKKMNSLNDTRTNNADNTRMNDMDKDENAQVLQRLRDLEENQEQKRQNDRAALAGQNNYDLDGSNIQADRDGKITITLDAATAQALKLKLLGAL